MLKELLSIMTYLTIIQLLFIGIKQGVFCFYPETLYSRSMVMMFTMIVCLVIMIIYCRRRKCSYNFFPKVFEYLYIIITIIAVIFYVVTLFWVKTFSFENSLIIFYGSIVTPVFEELLFRGIIADCQPKRPPVPYSAATLELKWRSAKDTLNGQNFQL